MNFAIYLFFVFFLFFSFTTHFVSIICTVNRKNVCFFAFALSASEWIVCFLLFFVNIWRIRFCFSAVTCFFIFLFEIFWTFCLLEFSTLILPHSCYFLYVLLDRTFCTLVMHPVRSFGNVQQKHGRYQRWTIRITMNMWWWKSFFLLFLFRSDRPMK